MTTHPAKSGNDWTAGDLAFYGVKIEYQDVQQFFGEVPLPAPSICQGFLTADTNNDATDRESAVLMYYLKLATDAPEGYKETILPFFVMVLFDSLGYNRGFCGRCSWAALPFLNSGQVRDVSIDAALMKSQPNCRISLVVHQDMLEGKTGEDATARLIAEAVAAFQFTNDTRRMEGLAELNGQVIPGIIMTGTLPTFFKIPITQELARSVESGQPTATPTLINGHVPGVLHPKDGMMPLDNRRVLLQCFEAFKRCMF
ncbi:hypothetical protein BDN70DRAFT_575000 [Pholiota conissans]|uniref:Uncharacterized protein n=1 Tax=Pholiota conissans TaxID=109636 RepID=A0A9P6D2V0_9AGAR|nr:hypothetical protein BDN70DRAFT_575000 [Pholiota conissans]